MRVCIDTNILISYLLRPQFDSPPAIIVRSAITGRFDLILGQAVIAEMLAKIEGKPYLSARISLSTAQRFVALLESRTSLVPESQEPAPHIVRDPKDDYLVALAVMQQADYLVSGDKDLLILGSVLDVRIVSPSDFALLLRTLET